MAETTNYNVENAMKDQEQNQNKVAKDAVQMAKENIAKRKLEEESRKVESRLQEASRQEDRALKELRVNRKKEAAAKKYLEDINAAKTTLSQQEIGVSMMLTSRRLLRSVTRLLRMQSVKSTVMITGVINLTIVNKVQF